MAKTNQGYKDEYLNANKGNTEQQIEKNKQSTEAAISQYNQGVDTQVQAAVNPYQQRIDEAPSAFREQYDDNHIAELINRKKVQESMANMGLTDSGLNRSQQTALAVQRGNADAATRKQQQDYVTAAQQAIDQIIATGESQKHQHAAQRNLEADNYANSLYQSLYNNANTYATNMVIADQEAASKAAENELKWSLAMLEKGYVPDGNGGYVAAPATADQQMEASKTVQDYIAKRVADDVPYEKAVQEAALIYGYEYGNNEAQNGNTEHYNSMIASADQVVNAMKLDVTGNLFDGRITWLKNERGDGNVVAKEVSEQLGKSGAYAKMSEEEKEITTAIAVGRMVAKSWSKAKDEADNETRVRVACNALGADFGTAWAEYQSAKPKKQEAER